MAKLFPEGVYPGQESVLSLRCQIERNKCQCRNLSPCKLTLSLCILGTLFRAFQHHLCHVDWRMAVHLLTMPLQRHALRVFIFHQLCWVELSKWTHKACGRNHFHPSRPAHASPSAPTISSEAEPQSHFFNFLLNKFLDQVWLTLKTVWIAVKNSSI